MYRTAEHSNETKQSRVPLRDGSESCWPGCLATGALFACWMSDWTEFQSALLSYMCASSDASAHQFKVSLGENDTHKM